MEKYVDQAIELGINFGIRFITALIILAIGLFLAKVVRSFVRKLMAKAKVDVTIATFVGNLTYIVCLAVVVIAVLEKIGIATTSFVAVLGAAGLAIGLALQGSLSNFASGFLLIIFRPFKVDDTVEIGGATGKVEEISLFTTTLNAADNKKIIIPNGKIYNNNIINFTANATRRLDLVFNICYEDDIDKAKQVFTVAFTAHDKKKEDLIKLAKTYESTLTRYKLIATKHTGKRLEETTKLQVECLTEAEKGGILQIAARVVSREIKGVIFLADPLTSSPYDADIQALLRICNLYDVPLATNIATAQLAIEAIAKRREAYLIFNPVAGQGNPDQDLALIRKILEPQMNLHVIFTKPDIDPADQAKQAVETIQKLQADDDEQGCIIASGGDGTVSAIAGATIETGIPLGVIPRGTANAFAVALGLPINLKKACENIAAGNTRMVDAARCNDIPMVLLAGVGFEAGMVNNANRELKNRLGSLAYILSGAQQFFTQEDFDATIELDGQVIEVKTGAVTVANAAPPTSVMAQGFGKVIPDDGLLEVTIPASSNLLESLNSSLKLLASAFSKSQDDDEKKEQMEDDNLVCLRTKQVKVTTDPPQKLVIDGEILEANPLEFTCIPKGLTVFSPLSTV